LVDTKKVTIELTINEAKILCKAIQGYSPPMEDEMVSIMLYARITRKVEEVNKNESL
jgi:hypothetical protein